jgi:hypothetical protein
MKLLTIRIPETEHLAVAEREEILKRCLTSEEMRRYKRIAPRVFGILSTAFAFGFFFLALFRWSWSILPAFAAFAALAVASNGLAFVTKIALEVWMLRRIIRRECRR